MDLADELLEIVGNIGSNKTNIRLLIDQLDSVIPFVGAGLSVGLGYKSWPDLLLTGAKNAKIEDIIRPILAKGQLEEAAERICAETSNAQFNDFIRSEFSESLLTDQRPLRSGAISTLPKQFLSHIITTNFDRAIEAAYFDNGTPFGPHNVFSGLEIGADSHAMQLHDGPVLIKLHGDYAKPSSRILTRSEYEYAYCDQTGSKIELSRPIPSVLRSIFSTKVLLFIGCSLSEDRTTLAALHIAEQVPGGFHFALVPDCTDLSARTDELNQRLIRPIYFQDGHFEIVEQFLEQLLSVRSALKRRSNGRERQVVPTYDQKNSPPLMTPAEYRFIDEAKRQLRGWAFPNLIQMDRATSEIRLRRDVLGGSFAISDLAAYQSDMLSWNPKITPDPPSELVTSLRRDVGRLFVSCESSSPSSIMMADVVCRMFDEAQPLLSGPTPREQVKDIIRQLPEVLIMAVAPYLTTNAEYIRKHYSFYAPFHPADDLILIRGSRLLPKKMFHIAETSGDEYAKILRNNGIIDRSTPIAVESYLDILKMVDEGAGVIIWPPFTEKLYDENFHSQKNATHDTWFGLFLRKDLCGDTPATKATRKSIMDAMIWAATTIRRGNLEDLIAGSPSLRARIREWW